MRFTWGSIYQAKTLLKAGNFMESKEQYERDIVEAETVFNKLTPLEEALKAAQERPGDL